MLQTGSFTGGSPTARLRGRLVELRLQGPARCLRAEAEGPWSRVYCGGGSKAKCRTMLQRTLAAAMKVTPAQLYGGGDGTCAADPQPACYDQNRPQVTAGIYSEHSRSRTGRPSSR